MITPTLKLTPDQEKKFRIAADILEENLKKTEIYKERSKGIPNGDSPRMEAAISRLLGK